MTSITPTSMPPRGPFSEQATFTPSPETSPRPIGAFDSCLGKRKFAEGDWFPGAGIPFYSFGYENDSKAKLYRTSILFTELKNQVDEMIARKHATDAKERQISAQIASQHPISFPESVDQPANASPQYQLECSKGDISEVEVVAKKGNSLPAPLTEAVLRTAYNELPAGARNAIETCVRCWREKKLGADEMLSTVSSFSGSSSTLASVFHKAQSFGQADEGEMATEDQFRELSLMAMSL
ncbi:hypothetical protein GUITHDRAFT_120268 [Guillardia theta CCMP2712]|uniref:Uncharacterized protein n=2 Tax=Guillardia theta TaxID=55529 RepID=L1IBB7_GUITC|nr:hypothetical protein GUITHDRAFT_120268 [Guillardia theta CCMP2712]EKX33523.1 hypothetical protein GUITHDRAFT_120268 [Guillardia theta CCMP2712]|eukprot:XP_005820503.1 hypothetical protein GUITHDRAFT_120268 [Guillardia theta CCMP2712]